MYCYNKIKINKAMKNRCSERKKYVLEFVAERTVHSQEDGAVLLFDEHLKVTEPMRISIKVEQRLSPS